MEKQDVARVAVEDLQKKEKEKEEEEEEEEEEEVGYKLGPGGGGGTWCLQKVRIRPLLM